MPYNRGGTGDLWFFSRKLVSRKGKIEWLKCLTTVPHPLRQGFDPLANPPFKKLSGLSIFSGCGNFDRGLEDGGAVEFRTAIDFSPEAIHTQKANARYPDRLSLYCGSVDDFLKAVNTGRFTRIGEVEFISGGSPCPGFSTLQLDPFSERSCRNASHITTICSYVDIFRPQYAIFENVINMAATRRGYEAHNVLLYVVACFVSMGYQVQFGIVDAWSFGSSQYRERLCISIAAPGLEPPARSWQTHSHPDDIRGRCLGKTSHGHSYGSREDHNTPFHFVTAGESTSDLPDIGAGTVQACILFPDHRMASPLSLKDRIIAIHIPRCPPGQGYAEAEQLGLIPRNAKKSMVEVGRAFRRIKSNGLFPTITTAMRVQNSRQNGILHWLQQRSITVQDARRAQSIPDEEVIIGRPNQQLQQIGNAVDRNVSLVRGLALREAWEKSCANGNIQAASLPSHQHTASAKWPLTIKCPEPNHASPDGGKTVEKSPRRGIYQILENTKQKQTTSTLPVLPIATKRLRNKGTNEAWLDASEMEIESVKKARYTTVTETRTTQSISKRTCSFRT